MKLAWAVSGRGMTLRAVLEAQAAGLLKSVTALVVTDRYSPIEEFVEHRGIPVIRLEPSHGNVAGFQEKLYASLLLAQAEWLGLTFNRLVSSDVIMAMKRQVFNVHMSLLPAFPGFGAIHNALASGVKISGVTIHIADVAADTGPIIGQTACPVLPWDSPQSLGRRLFEHGVPLVLQVLRSIEQGQIRTNSVGQPSFNFSPSPYSQAFGCYFPVPDSDVLEFSGCFTKTNLSRL